MPSAVKAMPATPAHEVKRESPEPTLMQQALLARARAAERAKSVGAPPPCGPHHD